MVVFIPFSSPRVHSLPFLVTLHKFLTSLCAESSIQHPSLKLIVTSLCIYYVAMQYIIPNLLSLLRQLSRYNRSVFYLIQSNAILCSGENLGQLTKVSAKQTSIPSFFCLFNGVVGSATHGKEGGGVKKCNCASKGL